MLAPRPAFSFIRSVATVLALTSLGAPAWAGVITVAPSGADFASLQAAADFAGDGDVLLVRTGTYSGLTLDAKALTVCADTNADVRVNGTMRVRHLAAGQTVVLSGLSVSSASAPALELSDSAGSVRVQGSMLRVWPSFAFGSPPAVVITSVADVAFHDCTLQGGPSASSAYAGGSGLTASTASIALEGCTVRGAWGAWPGGRGGAGAVLADVDLFAARTQFFGGQGAAGGVVNTGLGGCAAQVPQPGGDGGCGLAVAGVAHARLLASSAVGGVAGPGGVAICSQVAPPGANGLATSGVIESLAGTAREFRAPPLVREGGVITLECVGVPGEKVALFVSAGPAHAFLPAWGGALLVSNPFLRRVGLGRLSAAGQLSAQLAWPLLPPGTSAQTRHVQTVFTTLGQPGRLGPARCLTVVSSAY